MSELVNEAQDDLTAAEVTHAGDASDAVVTNDASGAAESRSASVAAPPGVGLSALAADNDGISPEARKLQGLLTQDTIDLSKADSDEAFATAEQVLAAHKVRFQRRQQGRSAALDALKELGLTIYDVGWTEVPKQTPAPAPAHEPSKDNEVQASRPKGGGASRAKRAGSKKGVLQVLKGSSPKVFYATGRVPKAGCFDDGTKDESKWRSASEEETAEYTHQRAKKTARR
jgi:hypothetical protein